MNGDSQKSDRKIYIAHAFYFLLLLFALCATVTRKMGISDVT